MSRRHCFPCLLVCTLLAVPLEAVVVPSPSALNEKAFRHPNLYIPSLERRLGELGPTVGPQGLELVSLGVGPDSGFYDWRAGRWGSLVLSQPLIPGDGKGNNLGAARPASEGEIWQAVSDYLRRHQQQLRIDLAELATPRVGIFDKGNLVQVHSQRVVGGIPVRDSGLTAIINHGNLVLLGLQSWGTLDATARPAVTLAEAEAAVAAYVRPFTVSGYKDAGHLELVPMARGESLATVAAGAGYDYRLSWVVTARIEGDLGSWEGLVDAASGDLISFQDKNQYAARKMFGGVYPVSNDQRPPDGIEQAGWPMPYADVLAGGNTTFTDSGGSFGCAVGNATTALNGQFLRIFDNCGPINETSAAGDLDLGFGPNPLDTDCVVPAGHSPGDTKSSRSGFYEMNRIIEQAKGHLALPWLDQQLLANMNINQACNAFWNGSVNFFRSSATCRNTGEIAGIFDHEWGHGLDNNGVNPNIASPGENIADTDANLRLNASCVGRGFFKNQVCGGYGDPCIGTPATGCTGVRDSDFAQHVSGLPHGITWIQSNCSAGGGPCGREVHCEGVPMGEVGWDLHARDLQAAPFNFDLNTALELSTRLWYLGQQTVTSWYQCQPTGGGCGATGGYMLLLAADDDNGDINDGTPHMTAIRGAFERHQMHCATPPAVNSGCAGGPTTAPTLSATPIDAGVNLSWTSVAGAARYDVYRTEGVNGCSFGKVKVGETTGLTFTDQGLQNGRTYFYSILPVGSNPSCFGLMSACATVVPAAGPNLAIRTAFTLGLTGGDGDGFLDNCETGTVGFTVENTGTGTLTNVRLVSVTPITHPSTVVTTPLPAPIAPTLADCATANGSFSFVPQGMAFGETTQLEIEVTADELGGATRSQIISINPVETDAVPVASRTYDFEADYSGWTVIDPPFTRESPGANGTNFHLHSSAFLDLQCDIVRSPAIGLTATSTLSLFNRYDTETPIPIPYDRANIGVVDLGTGVRTTIVPSGGRLYDLPPGSPNGNCGTDNQAGWAGTQNTFAISTWDSAAMNPGGMFTNRQVALQANYGTDPFVNGDGFRFDEVTVTNFDDLVPDAQPNVCGPAGLSINDVAVTEGNAGTTTATFTVTLVPPSGSTVTVDFATADGSATTANNDYTAASGTLTFAPGVTTQPLPVTVNGDTVLEANETFFVNLSNPVNAVIADGQGVGTINNDDGPAGANLVTELFHGYSELEDLAAGGGGPDVDFYRIAQKPYSSYEVLVDATSGDIGPPLDVQRMGPDGTTVLQNSVPTGGPSGGLNFSRSLRWANSTAAEVTNEFVRVSSVGCTTNCGPDDVYNIHAFETTYAIPRFNNAGTQVTVLLLQNPTNYDITGNIYFWNTAGTLAATTPFTLTAKQLQVLNTSTVAPGVGGAVTVAHNGRFGDLAGKTVALEPATGFSFDSPMLPRVKVN